jgi:hypothetical protein
MSRVPWITSVFGWSMNVTVVRVHLDCQDVTAKSWGRWRGVSAVADRVKAFEEPVFGPCTLRRTWGTRPPSAGFGGWKAPSGMRKMSTPRGPSTPRHKVLCYAIDLRSASLRMTTLLVGYGGSTKDLKSHRMTILWLVGDARNSVFSDFYLSPDKLALMGQIQPSLGGDSGGCQVTVCGGGDLRADGFGYLGRRRGTA